MTESQTIIIGAGPAGMRAAITLVEAGHRPVVLDEASRSGGQIYRRAPIAIMRPPKALYGFEAERASALHRAFDTLGDRIDYRPGTMVWNADAGRLHLITQGQAVSSPWRRLILASGAMDRIIPLAGWTLPGVYSLGAAQIAFKAQALSIGKRVVFFGTGPLLYLVAYQYAKAGIDVRAVLDTSAASAGFRALPGLARGGAVLLKGLYYLAWLRAHGVAVSQGVTPLEVCAGPDGAVAGLRFQRPNGQAQRIDCDAVGFGYGLKSETQIADLLGLAFSFNAQQRQWLPTQDAEGRGSLAGVYLAGDGARVRGADVAEMTGERAALTLLADDGQTSLRPRIDALSRRIVKAEPFRRALDETAFPFPQALARAVPDEVMVCRCEGIDAGMLRRVAAETGETDINRLKAFTRLGMGRCQGRVCGPAATEILSALTGAPVDAVGRIRGQAPIKPVPLAILAEAKP